MSASRDKNQKIAFVYSNLYQIYRNGKDAALKADVSLSSASPSKGQVIKAESLGQTAFASVRVNAYAPAQFIGKRISRPIGVKPELARELPASANNTAVEDLKKNLKTLNDLHSRLRFMLQELEELVREE